MEECFRCGVSGEKVRLYDAISEKGIVKVCSECASIENFPIIKKPTENQIAESQRQKSVRDMLTGMNRRFIGGREVTLRDLIDKNFKGKHIQLHPDLIENFHWTIQRIRRNRKITRRQFAKGIEESEATIRMVEQGYLPDNNYKVINKIESYFGVNLHKPGTSGFSESPDEQPKRLDFDRGSVSQLKIADLRDMKKRHEEEIFKPIDSWKEKRNESGEIEEDIEGFEDEEFFDED